MGSSSLTRDQTWVPYTGKTKSTWELRIPATGLPGKSLVLSFCKSASHPHEYLRPHPALFLGDSQCSFILPGSVCMHTHTHTFLYALPLTPMAASCSCVLHLLYISGIPEYFKMWLFLRLFLRLHRKSCPGVCNRCIPLH